jgi:hypothetical protein
MMIGPAVGVIVGTGVSVGTGVFVAVGGGSVGTAVSVAGGGCGTVSTGSSAGAVPPQALSNKNRNRVKYIKRFISYLLFTIVLQ